MAHEKVHVICENLCLEEGMTKGQIEGSINAEAERANNTFATQETVSALASGSPKGIYTDSAALKAANPETGVYVITGDGHIYSWTKNSTGDPIDLGVYQATALEYDYELDTNNAVPNSKTVGDVVRSLTKADIYADKYINLIGKTTDKTYVDYRNGNAGTNNDYELVQFDISGFDGYQLEISSHNGNVAGNVIVNTSNVYVYGCQGNSSSMCVPANAKTLKVSNLKNSGKVEVKVKIKKPIQEIYKETGKDLISTDYRYWESIIHSNQISYNAGVACVFNDQIPSSGYLTYKINLRGDSPVKVFVFNETGKVLDTYTSLLKTGINEVRTPIYTNAGDYIGVIVYNSNCAAFTNVQVPWKVSNEMYKIKDGENFTLPTGDTFNGSFSFDYQISTIKTIKIDDFNYVEDTILSEMLKKASNTLNIKLIGDSITHGVGGTGFAQDGDIIVTNSSGNTWRRNNGYCWAKLLKTNLESKYNCSVVNNGCSGVDSQFIVTYINQLISDTDDVVICMIGTNNRNSEYAYNRLYNDLRTIYNYCQERNIKFIPMASIPASVADETASNRYKHMEDINNIISSFAKENNLEYIDLFEPFYMYTLQRNVSLSSLLADGLHPNDAGYYLMYRLISKAIGVIPKIEEATW